MISPIPLQPGSQMRSAAPNPKRSDVPSPQSQADFAEKEALARYFALAAVWSPCWGVSPSEAPRRGRH